MQVNWLVILFLLYNIRGYTMKSEKIIRPCGSVLLKSNCFDVKDGVVRQMRWCQKVQDYYFDNPCRECPKKGK